MKKNSSYSSFDNDDNLIGQLIAEVASYSDIDQLLGFVNVQASNGKLSINSRNNFTRINQALVDVKSKDSSTNGFSKAKFQTYKSRIVSLLKIEEQNAKFILENPKSTKNNYDDNLLPKGLRDRDRESALNEINETVKAYINNALDQIEQHKINPKNNREAHIISLVSAINELLDNPEHKKYIKPNDLLISTIKLQNALNEISLGYTYRPLMYLLSLLPEDVNIFWERPVKKGVLKRFVWFEEKDREKLVKFLFESKNFVNSKIGRVLVINIIKVAQGNDELLKIVCAPDNNKWTPLHQAVRYGRTEVVRILLEAAKGNPELLKAFCAPDEDQQTPLHLAAEAGNTVIVEKLLEVVKENPELQKTLWAPDINQRTPLHLAQRKAKHGGDAALVKLLNDQARLHSAASSKKAPHPSSSTAITIPNESAIVQVDAARLTQQVNGQCLQLTSLT